MKTFDVNETYDAIVVGSGISGGWAAKELCENSLNTLVLERGRMVEHIKDYHTMNMDPWDFKFKGQLPKQNKPNKRSKGEQDIQPTRHTGISL